MDWLLPYLGPAAAPVAFMVAGAGLVTVVRRYVRKEAEHGFEGAVQPFMDAIRPLQGVPGDIQAIRVELTDQRQMIEGIRATMGQVSQTASDAHAMAVRALEKANAVEGAHGATASALATHLYRAPHAHGGEG